MIVVEDRPFGQSAIAPQVELPRTDAADGHADAGELVTAVNLGLTSGEETVHPRLAEVLIFWNVVCAELWFGVRVATTSDKGQSHRPSTGSEELAPGWVGNRIGNALMG
jgi:hypothetical protein